MDVYVVQHVNEFDDGREDVKFIGVYSTAQEAQAAVERLSMEPGFREWPTGFSVDRYELNRDHWTDGFVYIPRD